MPMNLRPLIPSLVLAAFAAISAPSACADTLPPVTMSYWGQIAALSGYQGSGPNQTYADSPGYTALGASPATVTYYPTLKGASGSASVSSGADPAVTVNATGVGAGISTLYYEFEVSGPTKTLTSVTIAGSGGATISNPSLGAASASLDIGVADVGAGVGSEYIPYGGPYVVQEAVCVGACGSGNTETSDSFSVNNLFDLQTNTIYAVEMFTEYSIGPGAVTASAFVDPTITLDTTDPAYSLEFSPGLIPTSATPEPSSLLLVATGLLGGAGVIRRRVFAR